MSLVVDLQVDVDLNLQEKKALESIHKALHSASVVENQVNKEVSVRVVDDFTMREMNRTYREVDRTTDVLSFPQWEPDEALDLYEDERIPLGDIVISLPKAKEQAEHLGHSLERELGFLSVHGFLHLLGYDHHTSEDSQQMFAKQEEILSRIGLVR